MKKTQWKGEIRFPFVVEPKAILKPEWADDQVYGLTRRVLKQINAPNPLHRCEACGVFEVFAPLHLDRVHHPASSYSYEEIQQRDCITVTAVYRCDDVRECLRRTTMKMK